MRSLTHACHYWPHAARDAEVCKTVAGLDQTLGQLLGSPWIEVHKVVGGTRDFAQRRRRPDDAHASGFGRRNSLAFSQPRQPFAYTLVRHALARVNLRVGSSVGRCFRGFVEREIEDRPGFGFRHKHLPKRSPYNTIRNGVQQAQVRRRGRVKTGIFTGLPALKPHRRVKLAARRRCGSPTPKYNSRSASTGTAADPRPPWACPGGAAGCRDRRSPRLLATGCRYRSRPATPHSRARRRGQNPPPVRVSVPTAPPSTSHRRPTRRGAPVTPRSSSYSPRCRARPPAACATPAPAPD